MTMPGYGGQQGIAYEGASKVLTPDGFDASQTLHALGHSAEELTQRSPDSLLSAQLLKTANWQDILKAALVADDDAMNGHEHGELNDEERLAAEEMYNDAHSTGGGVEEELDELDAELVDRIRGVKDKAEGRAVHLLELLGKVHETKIKKQRDTPTPAKSLRQTGLPPMPGTTSSQKRRSMRTGHSPIDGRVTYSDIMMKGSNDAGMAMAEQEQDISVLSSPTMSHNFTPQSLAAPPSQPPSSQQQPRGSQAGSPPRSPPREVPLHKAHTTSSSVKASPQMPHESLVTGNTTSSGSGIPPTPGSDSVAPFRPTALGANGNFIISTGSTPVPRGTPTPGGRVRAYAREQEQAVKLQALSHRVEHMTEQIARLERAILLVLDKHPIEQHMSLQLRAKIAFYDTLAGFKRAVRAVFKALLTVVSLVALYVVFFHGLKLTLFAATTYPLPHHITDPVIRVLEGLMGSSWLSWDEYTLPLRLLQIYQATLYPRFGYLGLCSAQAWLEEALFTSAEGAFVAGQCFLPLPAAPVSGGNSGWFS